MATGPYKRIVIDIKLDPNEKNAKVDVDHMRAAMVVALNKVMKNTNGKINFKVTWYMKTLKGAWK